MNVQNMLKVARELTPNNYLQNSWSCCIAYHATKLALRERYPETHQEPTWTPHKESSFGFRMRSGELIDWASKYLDLDANQATKLFNGMGDSWPEEAKRMLDRSMIREVEGIVVDPVLHVKAGVLAIQWMVAEYMLEGLPSPLAFPPISSFSIMSPLYLTNWQYAVDGWPFYLKEDPELEEEDEEDQPEDEDVEEETEEEETEEEELVYA